MFVLLFSLFSSFAGTEQRICVISNDNFSKYKIVESLEDNKKTTWKTPDLNQISYSDLSCKRDGQKCKILGSQIIKRVAGADQKRLGRLGFYPVNGDSKSGFYGYLQGKCKIKEVRN